MNKHTPGPWEALIQSMPFRESAMVRTGAGHLAIDCEGSGETEAESAANANLIAAAPELLAALREIVYVYHSANSKEPEVVAARAVIARATGAAS